MFSKSRHNKNKRSFDVAFLAGTHGNSPDGGGKVLNSDCEEENKRPLIGDQSTISNKYYESEESLMLKDSCKSAFKKVKQQKECNVTIIKQKDANGKIIYSSKCLEARDADDINTIGNKVDNNNSSPKADKDNESNRSIGPKGNIQSIEHRVT